MNAKRLLKLADLLDTVPRKKFDFSLIFVDMHVKSKRAAEKQCGAVGCALGWANTVPEFRRAGFKIENMYADCDDEPHCDPWKEAARLFDIDDTDTRRLFMPMDEYSPGRTSSGLPETATPKQVARHIRKFVKERSREI